MIGAIIGDIVGSRFEYDNIKIKDFELFTDDCHFTDDTVLTVAVAGALLDGGRPSYSQLQKSAKVWLRGLAKKYPDADYGTRFEDWVNSKSDEPTNSYGNGAASRISPVGFVTTSREQTIILADTITDVTHNHMDALIGASAVAVSTYYARIGWPKDRSRNTSTNIFTKWTSLWMKFGQRIRILWRAGIPSRRRSKRFLNRPVLRMLSATRFQSVAIAILPQLPAV